MGHVVPATVAALTLLVGAQSVPDDDPPGDAARSCVDRLLDIASTNTDSSPHLRLFPRPADATGIADARGIQTTAMCLADDRAPGIMYAVVDGEVTVDADLGGDVAVGDDVVIAEDLGDRPGDDAHERLDDPGETWSDVDGVADLVDQLWVGDVDWIELGRPDSDRSPVHTLGASVQPLGEGSEPLDSIRVVWQFPDGTAAAYTSAIEAMLSDEGVEPVAVEATGTEVLAVIEQSDDPRRQPGWRPRLLDLSLRDVTIEDEVQRFPDVLDAQATCTDRRFDFAVTISSPYDTPERYADGWRVVGPDGMVYGEHTLAHDHAAEQPFTRTQRGVEIPAGVEEVVVEGRDIANGYGGETVSVSLPDC